MIIVRKKVEKREGIKCWNTVLPTTIGRNDHLPKSTKRRGKKNTNHRKRFDKEKGKKKKIDKRQWWQNSLVRERRRERENCQQLNGAEKDTNMPFWPCFWPNRIRTKEKGQINGKVCDKSDILCQYIQMTVCVCVFGCACVKQETSECHCWSFSLLTHFSFFPFNEQNGQRETTTNELLNNNKIKRILKWS